MVADKAEAKPLLNHRIEACSEGIQRARRLESNGSVRKFLALVAVLCLAEKTGSDNLPALILVLCTEMANLLSGWRRFPSDYESTRHRTSE
ncbi:hypothetical protein AA0116_g13484 [Alternaria tenuissima]|nr:hypothetical protein AA0116_g13484 [Alternaria tenuissima]